MYRICKSILLNEKDCCDVIQTTLLKSYKNLHTLKDNKYFKTWLLRILINECNNMRKHQKRIIETDNSILHAIADDSDDYRDLYIAIDRLSEKYRQVIILHYLNGYSTKELSDLLSIPEGTVKSRLYTARGELKKTYGEVQFA